MSLTVFNSKTDSTVYLRGATDRFTIFNSSMTLPVFNTDFYNISNFVTNTTKRISELNASSGKIKELIGLYNPPQSSAALSVADIIGYVEIPNILLYQLTKEVDLSLPNTIYMIVAPQSIISTSVLDWLNNDYDYIRPNTYTFTADYSIPEFRTNPPVSVNVYFMFTINASSTGVLASHNEIDGVLASYE